MKKYTLALLLSLSACSLAPDYLKPDAATPAWHGAEATDELPDADWWSEFGNDEMNSLLKQSLTTNNDLRASLQRIEQSRANARISASSLLPTLDSTASANRNYSDLVHGDYSTSSAYRGGVQASYAVDLFARNRSASDAASLSADASAYDRDALVLVVQSDTAQAFINYLSLTDRLKVAQENLKNTADVLRITQARFNAGTLSALELAQQKTAYANTQASLASLTQQRENAHNQLAVLMGKPPQDFTIQSNSFDALDIPEITPLQPATLVARRPDIQAAEAQLHAANYDIGAARAAFFPTLQLSASTVLAANPSGTPAALTASLLQPLFRGGALQAGLDLSKARKAELEEQYIKTVLTAFQEVEDALAAQTAADARLTAYAEASVQAQKAYSLARQRFNVGTIDFLTLLDTQSRQFSAQDALITAKQAQLVAAITLFSAIGGAAQLQPEK